MGELGVERIEHQSPVGDPWLREIVRISLERLRETFSSSFNEYPLFSFGKYRPKETPFPSCQERKVLYTDSWIVQVP